MLFGLVNYIQAVAGAVQGDLSSVAKPACGRFVLLRSGDMIHVTLNAPFSSYNEKDKGPFNALFLLTTTMKMSE